MEILYCSAIMNNNKVIKIYGITNCSTVAKAIKWLETNNLEFKFWNYKKQGIDSNHLNNWCNNFGWEKVINRSGMMWRKADQKVKDKVIDQHSAMEFMILTPNSIKRPVIEIVDNNTQKISYILGFDETVYSNTLK